MKMFGDGCGCFPTGKHYPGIAHLLQFVVRGLAAHLDADQHWSDWPVAMIDVETTGLDAKNDRIVELAIVIGQSGEVLSKHQWLIYPERPIPEGASNVHGIRDADVKDCPRFSEIANEVKETLHRSLPAAYNADFDRGFLHAEFARTNIDTADISALQSDVVWIDPLIWARTIYVGEKSRALGEVAQKLGIQMKNAHRAEDDAETALRVLYALSKDERLPQKYGPFIAEQRRIADMQKGSRRFWKK